MSSAPARVLHVVGAMDRGGAESMLMSLYRAIDRTKIQFDFLEFTPNKSDFTEEILELGGRVLKCAWSQHPKQILGTWKQLRNIIENEGPFIAVHSHVLFASGFVASGAKHAGVPIRISHSHSTSDSGNGFLAKSYRKLSRWFIKRNSTVHVACSSEAGDYLFGSKFSKNGGLVLPNSVDLAKFHPSAEDPTKTSNGQMMLVSIARLEPVKNHMFLICLADELRARGEKFTIIFVGKGSLEEELKQLIVARGLQNHIEMVGLRTDIAQIMRDCDALLMPSLWEGLPVTLIEAQASGLSCLVSDTVTRDADMGLGLLRYISTQEVSEWADVIQEGFPWRPGTATIQSAFADRGYTLEASIQKLLPLYTSAIQR